MRYDSRNRATIEELAPNTKQAALKWYEYCVKNKVNILIYEGMRTVAEQAQNVAKGASKTMRSYHLVGQAIDFVPVDSKGNAIWSLAAYKKEPYKKAIEYAKSLGFEWGGDWKNFVDAPHLQFNYKGYGTDKVLEQPKVQKEGYYTVVAGDSLWKIGQQFKIGVEKIKSMNDLTSDVINVGQELKVKEVPVVTVKKSLVPYPGKPLKKGSKGKDVERVQRALGLKPDGDFGPATDRAVKAYQQRKGLKPDGIIGPNTWYMMF